MKRPSRSLVKSPTVRVRPSRRPRAIGLGVKARRCAEASTRSRVASATSPRPLRAFDAVAMETPASRATSPRVVVRAFGSIAMAPPFVT